MLRFLFHISNGKSILDKFHAICHLHIRTQTADSKLTMPSHKPHGVVIYLTQVDFILSFLAVCDIFHNFLGQKLTGSSSISLICYLLELFDLSRICLRFCYCIKRYLPSIFHWIIKIFIIPC